MLAAILYALSWSGMPITPPDAPVGQPDVRLEDTCRFPTHAQCEDTTAGIQAAERAWRSRALALANLGCHDEAARANAVLSRCCDASAPWWALWYATDPSAYEADRAESLRRLRDLIGVDAYERGLMPCPLPLELYTPLPDTP